MPREENQEANSIVKATATDETQILLGALIDTIEVRVFEKTEVMIIDTSESWKKPLEKYLNIKKLPPSSNEA